MGFTDGHGQKVERTGLVLSYDKAETRVTSRTMFLLTFPEADQRVFECILKRCEDEKAYKLKRKEFIEWTRKALIRVAKGIASDSLITDKTQYAIVYNYLISFIDKRNNLIRGLKGEKA